MILAWVMGMALVVGELPPEPQRAMLADVQHLYRGAGNRLWPGFDKVPLDLVLIGPERETLFCHGAIRGFVPAGFDPLTKCALQSRRRELISTFRSGRSFPGRSDDRDRLSQGVGYEPGLLESYCPS